jgi:putative endonuclease
MGYVYILTNDNRNVLYVGCTKDLRKRLYHHKHRLVPGFTKKYNVHRLVYFEVLQDIEGARRREQSLKGIKRVKKDALIKAFNPEWRDLYGEIAAGAAEEPQG